MRLLKAIPWFGFGLFLILHGIAHSPAILGSWKLLDSIEDVSRQPNILLTNAGDGLIYVLGFFWLLAAVSFVIAGIAVLRTAYWWPMAVSLAIVLSLPMTMLWREDAVIGLIINALILAGMSGYFLIGIQQNRAGKLA